MDPRAVLHPVGPLPPRTYWLRRLAPLAILLALLIVVAVSCSGGGSAKKPTAASGPTGSPTPSFPPSTRSSTTGTGTPPGCTRAALEVTASTDATKYPAGSLPRLVVTVRNTGLAA